MRKTKIICTLGPSTDDDDILRKLMIEGMNVARFNFSHGDHAQHKRNMERIMKFRTELNLPVATLLDTKGPEIRVKDFKNGKIELKPGQTFTFTTDEVEGDEKMASPGIASGIRILNIYTIFPATAPYASRHSTSI